MPITLGCPSCGKRFRARDESAGKKVKCPYCQAAVPVPTAEESATAGAPTAPLPPPEPVQFPPPPPPARPAAPPSRPPMAPSAPVVASPDDWGALPGPTAPVPTAPPRPFAAPPPPESTPAFEPEPEPNPFPTAAPRDRADKPRAKPIKPESKKEPKKKEGEKTPEEVLAQKWASVRRGLFWVQFALLFVAMLGFVGFGKAVYARSVGELPTTRDAGVIKIEGYVNTDHKDAIPLSKAEELNLLVYGVPVLIAGFLLTIGRLFSSGGPRSSGARGLFVLSGLLTLAALVALFASVVCEKMQFRDEAAIAGLVLLVGAPLAEFWFLTALTASGLALKRPSVARAVGFVAFLLALIPVVATVGWEQYVLHSARPKEKAPVVAKTPVPKGAAPQPAPAPQETNPALVERRMYEQAALMFGWLILVASYSRAVRGVRVGAFEYIAAVEDAKANASAEK